MALKGNTGDRRDSWRRESGGAFVDDGARRRADGGAQ